MISQKTIDAVRNDIDFAELAKELVPDLKQHGATLKAPCPFPSHAEHTPSFTVSPAKHMYKCFGCGKGGNDNVKFTMDIKLLTFPDAVRWLCSQFNIELEETEETPEAKEQQLKRADYIKLNRQVADMYTKNLVSLTHNQEDLLDPVLHEIFNNRKLTNDTVVGYELGYAIDDFKAITPWIIQNNFYQMAIDLRLIMTQVGTSKSYDTYRDRIIFPIHNENGEIIGFGGRKMERPSAADKDKSPKYLNSGDSPIYKKNSVLYGLYQAGPYIRKMGFACLVEGYYDVLSFSQTGMPNTVGSCGTAWTEGQAKLLKRYTSHVILIGDGDIAGMRAQLKAVDVFLKEGFKVDICPMPKGEDPDSFARTFEFIGESEEQND